MIKHKSFKLAKMLWERTNRLLSCYMEIKYLTQDGIMLNINSKYTQHIHTYNIILCGQHA